MPPLRVQKIINKVLPITIKIDIPYIIRKYNTLTVILFVDEDMNYTTLRANNNVLIPILQ